MKCTNCGYDDNGTGDSAHFCPASPVQGAASASGEAKGAAVKPWQERARERWPDFPAEQLGQWAATECKDAEIADWRALAKRAQAAQPSGAVHERAQWWLALQRMPCPYNERDHGTNWQGYAHVWTEAIVSAMRVIDPQRATPAPEQEAAFKNDLGWGKCQVLKSEAAQVEREVPMCDSCDNEAMRLPDGSFGTCQDCVNFAAPVAQEAERPQGDVMRPFGATAGQHGAGGEVLTDVRIVELAEAWAMTSHAYQSTPLNHCLDFARAIEAELASGSREGRDGCTKSGASSTAFDDQYAEDPTGAANTNKGGEA